MFGWVDVLVFNYFLFAVYLYLFIFFWINFLLFICVCLSKVFFVFFDWLRAFSELPTFYLFLISFVSLCVCQFLRMIIGQSTKPFILEYRMLAIHILILFHIGLHLSIKSSLLKICRLNSAPVRGISCFLQTLHKIFNLLIYETRVF